MTTKNDVIIAVSNLERELDRLESSFPLSSADKKLLSDLEGNLFVATMRYTVSRADPLFSRCWKASAKSCLLQSDEDNL